MREGESVREVNATVITFGLTLGGDVSALLMLVFTDDSAEAREVFRTKDAATPPR